jgi:hypothetical protein
MEEYRMIDGKDVSDFLSGFLYFVKKVINYLLSSLKEHYIAAILVFILSAAAGIFLWYRTGNLYESEMVCEFNDLSKKIYGEMVQKLDDLAKTRSYNALSTNLHLPLEDAREIVSIEGTNISGSKLYEDFTPDRGPMYFKVTATNNHVFAPLQKALLDYLNNNSPYRSQTDQLEIERIKHKNEFLNKDILLVDSLIAAYPNVLKNINPFDTTYKLSNIPTLLHYKSDLEEDLLKQEWREKELRSSVELLYGFVPTDHIEHVKNKKLIITILLAWCLSCFVAVLLKGLKGNVNQKAV